MAGFDSKFKIHKGRKDNEGSLKNPLNSLQQIVNRLVKVKFGFKFIYKTSVTFMF